MREVNYNAYDYSYRHKRIIEKKGHLGELILDIKMIEDKHNENVIPNIDDLNRLLRSGFYPRGGTWEPFEISFEEYDELIEYLCSLDLKQPYKVINKPCDNCRAISRRFYEIGYNEFRNLRDLVNEGRFEFLAGSCPLDEIETHIEREDLYTIEHYFKCKCGLIYYTGFCIRGRPIVKIIENLPHNIDITISGKYGSYFNKS